MDFAFSEEQDEFREVLARFLAERWPVSESRRLQETSEGFDPTVWKQMSAELGLQGLAIPEQYDGQGFSFLELGIALEEMGRQLAGGPYFATVCLAAQALLHVGDEAQKREWLPAIAAGELLATLACGERGGFPDPDDVHAVCEPDGEGLRVSGAASWIPHGHGADLILIAARRAGTRGAEGVSLLAVRGDAEGVHTSALDTMDGTRKLGSLLLEGAPAQRIGPEDGAWPGLQSTLDGAAIALAAEMAGGTARCLDMAVEHAKGRIQFARAIGSFQAVKHKAAEVLLELESARSAAYWSWWVAAQPESSGAELATAASIAKSVCGDAFLRAAEENIQIHGGMGFTWEADPHLYYRRAKSASILFGDALEHRARLASGLGF